MTCSRRDVGHGVRHGRRRRAHALLLVVHVPLATAASEASGGDHRHGRGGGEHDDQAGVERPGDQLREELPAGQRGRLLRVHLLQRTRRAEQLLDRVEAEEGREQARHRRQPRPPGAATCALTPWPVRPPNSVEGSALARPRIISEKKTPIDSDVPELKNVPRMPDAMPRWFGRHAVHDRRGVRRGEQPRADAVERDEQREHPVREVHRDEEQPDEGDRGEQQAAGGEPAGAEPVRQRPGHRAGEQEARRSAAACRSRPTAGSTRSCSRAAAARCPAAR